MGLRLIGALFYASKLYSVLVGAAFILLVTRNLSPEEFGAWGVISSLLAYALLASFVNFWVTRLRAFGEKDATTAGLALALLFSAVSTSLFALLLPSASSAFAVPQAALSIALTYIPVQYVNSVLYASVYASKPAAAAASEVLFETFKLVAALALAMMGKITLVSALLAVLAGYVAQLLALAATTWKEIVQRVRPDTVKRILSYSWVTALGAPISLIASADVLLISHYAGNSAVAFYTVVLPFMNLISYSYFLARGLYQKLLTAGEASAAAYTEEALRLVLVIGVPAALGSIALAPSLLYIMNPLYITAAPVLRVAALAALLGSVNSVLSDSLQGIERADFLGVEPRQLVKTVFFKLTVLGYARAFLTITGISAVVLTLHTSTLDVATLSRLVGLLAEAITLAFLVEWAEKRGFKLPLTEATKFVLASLAMCIVVVLANPLRIREVLLVALLGASVYFATLYLVDNWFRTLVTCSLRRLSLKFKIF